jgi:hypothetical protein
MRRANGCSLHVARKFGLVSLVQGNGTTPAVNHELPAIAADATCLPDRFINV